MTESDWFLTDSIPWNAATNDLCNANQNQNADADRYGPWPENIVKSMFSSHWLWQENNVKSSLIEDSSPPGTENIWIAVSVVHTTLHYIHGERTNFTADKMLKFWHQERKTSNVDVNQRCSTFPWLSSPDWGDHHGEFEYVFALEQNNENISQLRFNISRRYACPDYLTKQYLTNKQGFSIVYQSKTNRARWPSIQLSSFFYFFDL